MIAHLEQDLAQLKIQMQVQLAEAEVQLHAIQSFHV
jgi:hypothetical protein